MVDAFETFMIDEIDPRVIEPDSQAAPIEELESFSNDPLYPKNFASVKRPITKNKRDAQGLLE